jgi:hypothetical protein
MPRYKIKNEQVLTEFMDKFWKAIGQRKGRKFVKALWKDPVMVGLVRDAEEIADKILDRALEDNEEWKRDFERKYPDYFK